MRHENTRMNGLEESCSMKVGLDLAVLQPSDYFLWLNAPYMRPVLFDTLQVVSTSAAVAV